MLNYDNYIYNQNCVFDKQNRKDRLEKQLGDFGEQLVMTLLGRVAGYSVAYVDHEGADLIATDNRDEFRFAISVKSAQIGPNENETKVFKMKDQEKLCVFARDFGLIPTVAMLFIPKDFAFVDVYLVTLDAFQKLASLEDNEVEKEAVKSVTTGLQINNYSLGTGKKNIKHSDKRGYLKYLQSNELIEHVRMDVHNRDNFRKGIRQVSKDGLRDIECVKRFINNDAFQDKNLPRQLGDAGEYLLTMLLGQQKKYKVARVDHVGADLIAADSKGNRYAISVKTRHDKSYEFYELYTNVRSVKTPKNELGKLQDFSDKYGMIPVVALIFIEDSFKRMDIYISSLDNWIRNASGGAICFKPVFGCEDMLDVSSWRETMSSLKINICKPKYREEINSIKGIEHMGIEFLSSLDPNIKWE